MFVTNQIRKRRATRSLQLSPQVYFCSVFPIRLLLRNFIIMSFLSLSKNGPYPAVVGFVSRRFISRQSLSISSSPLRPLQRDRLTFLPASVPALIGERDFNSTSVGTRVSTKFSSDELNQKSKPTIRLAKRKTSHAQSTSEIEIEITPPPSSSSEQKWNERNWKYHPELNPTLVFPTWAVPKQAASIIQTLLSSELTQTYLATRDEILQQCHPRPHIVQDGVENDPERPNTHKYILLSSSAKNGSEKVELTPEVADLLQQHNVQVNGPTITIDIAYHQFPVSLILEKLLPKEVHPPPSAFEMVGHVAHMNLKEHHLPYATLIGHVLLECLPNIETVIQKVGQVSGPYRTYDYQVLAGRNDTTVQLMEHGVKLEFDLSKVYWCSRLASERQVVLDQEIKADQVVADAFCGVGAICLRAAQTKNCTILANDWNPNAVEYLRHNFALNRLERYLAQASNQDAYDFLMDLGMDSSPDSPDQDEQQAGDKPTIPKSGNPIVNHVLMNFPLKAPTFLGALRWWSPPLSKSSPRLHVYTFARADPTTDRSAEDVAVDAIASELLPPMGYARATPGDDGSYHRRQELNDEYDCHVVAREIRDVAPGKVVFCVSFTATPKLLRHMQGDFD